MKFKIIWEISSKNTFNIKILCAIAKISVSGYYKHKKKVERRQTKEDKELVDLKNIKEICLKYKRKYWYRTVTMKLQQKWIVFNHKKVLRFMKKYSLLSIIRKKDPYSKIRKATQEHSTAQNILKREFRWLLPFKKLGTDISYLRYRGKWIYLSVVKDMISWEILSNQISDNLELTIVQDSLKDLECLHLDWALIHSDQWFHYTHPSFSLWIKKLGCIQSMSRRWNCIDNAPTESFFGHLKDEIDISCCNTLEEVKKYIDSYIFEYNNERPQWHRKKMTPVQYRNHLLSSVS